MACVGVHTHDHNPAATGSETKRERARERQKRQTDREREREEQDTRSNWRPSRHDTPNYHSAKRALIDPGDSSPSRMQAYGCRACAGVFGSGGGHPTLTSPLGNPAGVTIRIGRATEGALNCT